MAAIRLLDDVYLVGSGGIGISTESDCHVYLLDGGTDFALIDAGSGVDPALILRNIDEIGLPLSSISSILITHGHWDHSGGAAALHDATGAAVIAAAESVHMLERDLWADTMAGRLGMPMRGVTVDRVVLDGDVVTVGKRQLKVMAVPGHTDDSLAYCAELSGLRCAFTGDIVDGQGHLGSMVISPVLLKYESSLRKVAAECVQALLPGHNLPVLRNGAEILSRTADHIATKFRGLDTVIHEYSPSWWIAQYPEKRLPDADRGFRADDGDLADPSDTARQTADHRD